MDYIRNRRYFETINWILVGILIVIVAILLYFYIWIGIISLLGLGTYIFFKQRDLPTEEEIDAVISEQIQKVTQKGYEKLGLDADQVNEIDPVLIHGPLLQEISYEPAVKRGKDFQVRSSNYNMSIFYFSEQQVYLYNHSFSLIDDEQNEVIGECFYDDIVTIFNSTTMTMYFDERRKRDDFFALDTLNICTSNGINIECPIQDLQVVQANISRMKKLVREKKEN